MIWLFDRASVEPLSVNVAVLSAELSFVNDSVPRVIVPMVFVLVVCVAPPKETFQVPEVVGIVVQLSEAILLVDVDDCYGACELVCGPHVLNEEVRNGDGLCSSCDAYAPLSGL